MGRGEAGQWEDGWGGGDEGSNSSELSDIGRGEEVRRARRRVGVLVMKEAVRVSSVVWVGGEKGEFPNSRTRGTMERGSAEVVSITGVVRVERDKNGNTFSTNLT